MLDVAKLLQKFEAEAEAYMAEVGRWEETRSLIRGATYGWRYKRMKDAWNKGWNHGSY